MIRLILALAMTFMVGCVSLVENLPDFQDGTWQNCTYTKGGKTKGPFPFQIPPGLQVPNISDAVDINCVPIKKVE